MSLSLFSASRVKLNVQIENKNKAIKRIKIDSYLKFPPQAHGIAVQLTGPSETLLQNVRNSSKHEFKLCSLSILFENSYALIETALVRI